jgi:hypothetical protein
MPEGVQALQGLDQTPEAPLDHMTGDTLHQRETLQLIRAYYSITDPAVRKRVMALLRSLAPED